MASKKLLSILAGSFFASATAIAGPNVMVEGDFDVAVDWDGCIAEADAIAGNEGALALAEALSGVKVLGSGVAGLTVTRVGRKGAVKYVNLAAALQSASLTFADADALAAAVAEGGEVTDVDGFPPFIYTIEELTAVAGAAGGAFSESLNMSLAEAFQFVTVSGHNIEEFLGGMYLGTLQFNMTEAAVGELAGALAYSIEQFCLFGACFPTDVDLEEASYAAALALARAIAMGHVDVWTLAHYKDNYGPCAEDDLDVWTNASAVVSCRALATAGAAAGSID